MIAKTEFRSLAVNLTEEEILRYSKELARNTQELRDKENRKKEAAKMMDAEISGHKAQVDMLSLKVANGYEYRDVECYWKIDQPNETKTLFRNDTGEIVKIEKLTSADLQKKLGE